MINHNELVEALKANYIAMEQAVIAIYNQNIVVVSAQKTLDHLEYKLLKSGLIEGKNVKERAESFFWQSQEEQLHLENMKFELDKFKHKLNLASLDKSHLGYILRILEMTYANQ